MSQFQCPLCGKYSSYSRYDPTNFEDDIFGVDFVGLGKAKGFRISARYSLLNDGHLRGLIVQRSRRILWFIEGTAPVSSADLQAYIKANKELKQWGENAQRKLNENEVVVNNFESQNRKLRNENNVMREQLQRSGPSVFAVEAEQLRRKIREWTAYGEQTKRALVEKDAEIIKLRTENQRMRKDLSTLREQLEESEEESVYAAEAESLLEKINESCNTDYSDLSQAIDFLLE